VIFIMLIQVSHNLTTKMWNCPIILKEDPTPCLQRHVLHQNWQFIHQEVQIIICSSMLFKHKWSNQLISNQTTPNIHKESMLKCSFNSTTRTTTRPQVGISTHPKNIRNAAMVGNKTIMQQHISLKMISQITPTVWQISCGTHCICFTINC
jgi:hypothetical protein